MSGNETTKDLSHFFLSINAGNSKSLLVHDDVSWLKEVASWNILSIFVTLLVSKFETSPLKEVAPPNIDSIFVTLLVCHAEISSSNVS